MTNTGAPGPQCAVEALSGLVAALRDWDADVDAVLARIGLEARQLSEPGLRIPHECFHNAWMAAEEIVGDPAIGLHVIEHLDLAKISLFTYLASTSATPREAYHRAKRYLRVVHDALEIELRFEEGHSVCETRFRGWNDERPIADYAVGLIVKVAPAVVGELPDLTAWFAHPRPHYADEYDRVLGVPVRFDAPCNGIHSEVPELDRVLPGADPALCALLEQQAEAMLERVPLMTCLADQVRHQIASALPNGDPSAEAIASSLGMSARTLRRRLSEAGVSHLQILDEVRCELAEHALGQPSVSIGEVAYLLGFSDSSAFHKAFRRWTGRSPGTPSTRD